MKSIAFALSLLFIFTGCSFKGTSSAVFEKKKDRVMNNVFSDLNSAVFDVAEQLFRSSKIDDDKKVAITSFVNLDNLNSTNTLGRVLGESMINELHVRDFDIIDYRGQDAISLNKRGEFHLTRDVSKVRPMIENSYVLVGTFSSFDYNSVILNARIMDFSTGDILSTARVVYKYRDCRLFNLCKTNNISITDRD